MGKRKRLPPLPTWKIILVESLGSGSLMVYKESWDPLVDWLRKTSYKVCWEVPKGKERGRIVWLKPKGHLTIYWVNDHYWTSLRNHTATLNILQTGVHFFFIVVPYHPQFKGGDWEKWSHSITNLLNSVPEFSLNLFLSTRILFLLFKDRNLW